MSDIPKSSKINFHIDMNAFFASCEQVKNPKLTGKPVIVGGNSSRSVVSAASYEARKMGVHAGMPYFKAYELCPDGVYLPVDMEYYINISRKIFKLLNNWTYNIEQVGVDEGFMGMDGAIQLFGQPLMIAQDIIKTIKNEVGINYTIGIGRTKSVAKLASGLAKPTNKKGGSTGFVAENGVLEIKDEDTETFLQNLDINQLYGVGRKTAEKLHKLGINKVYQLLETPEKAVENALGEVISNKLYRLATGSDYDEIIYDYSPPKSIGREVTLKENTRDFDEINNVLLALSDDIAKQLRTQKLYAFCVTLTIKTFDHIRHTRSITLDSSTNSAYIIHSKAIELLKTWLSSDTRDIRLIGISTSNFADGTHQGEVISLFDSIDSSSKKISKIKNVERMIDQISDKLENKPENEKYNADVHIGFIYNKSNYNRKMGK